MSKLDTRNEEVISQKSEIVGREKGMKRMNNTNRQQTYS
jgi:hypothetical protein